MPRPASLMHAAVSSSPVFGVDVPFSVSLQTASQVSVHSASLKLLRLLHRALYPGSFGWLECLDYVRFSLQYLGDRGRVRCSLRKFLAVAILRCMFATLFSSILFCYEAPAP
eukprot:5677203-Amphidinium_carterae.1